MSSTLYIIDIIYNNNNEIYKYLNTEYNKNDFYVFLFKLILCVSSIENIEIFKDYVLKINHICKNNTHLYTEITLYDLYIYSSYIMENYIVAYIFFNLIMNNNFKIENNKVNVRKLYNFIGLLRTNNIYNETKMERFNYIDDSKNYGYINKFIYFVNFAYFKLKCKKKYVSDYSNNQVLFLQDFDKIYLQEIDNFYRQFNNNDISVTFYDNRLDSDSKYYDLIYLVDHIISISNNDLYEIVLKNFCNVNNLSEIENINNVYTFMRFIYSNNLQIVKIYETRYNTPLKDIFYLFDKESKSEYLISSEQYLTDITNFMNSVHTNIQKYMYNTIHKYVTDFYITKKNSCIDKDCSICLDKINSDDFSYCNFCNNYYHSNCHQQLMENHTKCALCRQDLYPNSISHCTFKYNLFKKILENINF